MEIPPLTLGGLQLRLLELLRSRIRNGDLSERSLARLTGISQPHVHNVLKGVRTLSPELADVMLSFLRITPLDLVNREELAQQLTRTNPHRESRLHPVPVLSGLLGLNQPIPRKGPQREVHTVPLYLTQAATEPLVASLAGDPEMEPLFADRDLVLLDQSETARTLFQSEGYYVVRTEDGPCVRGLQRQSDRLFLITMKNREDSTAWESISLTGRELLDIVLARVIWLNRRRRWEDHVA
jgi:transcriptional regulator with XRE-family HTH domain